jgi:SNF2 family DNA or RNA helicase
MNLPDVILTTYQTVESEYRRIENKKGPLASVHWKRVILDEGETRDYILRSG